MEPEFCRCGHDQHAHSHYRRGRHGADVTVNECALCECPRWRPRRWWHRAA
jgi:hypothetical protein